jgi:alpha-L-fucosidase
MRMLIFLLVAATLAAQNYVDIKPSPQQVIWQDLEIGVLIHFGPNSFMDREWGEGNADPSVFNPRELDAEQWVTAAKVAGATYLVMVAKHHDGFCLWPSRHTDYSVESSPWRDGKGDLVGEVEAACRKHGLKFGVYLSPWDRHEPAYADNAAYDEYYMKQVTELATRYGEIVEFWLDGAGSEGHVYDFEKYVERLRTYQPNSLIFADVGFLPWGDIRWVGNEDGFALEDNWNVVDRHGYLRWRPGEADTPLRHRNWFWHPNAEDKLKSLDQLMEIYHKSVGRGAQLVLGLAPDDRGLIPEVDAARLKEFGDEVNRLYGKSVAEPPLFRHEALDGDPSTFWSAEEGAHSATITIIQERRIKFDRASIMEWLPAGQRVQKYSIWAEEGDTMVKLTEGRTIGHKKIDVFERTTSERVELRIEWASESPHIREFQLFDSQR